MIRQPESDFEQIVQQLEESRKFSAGLLADLKSRSAEDPNKVIALQEQVHDLMSQKQEWLQERIYLRD